jgi:hypothetical protein
MLYDKTEEDLISVMATARMFNLDSAADIISKVMFSIVTIDNVVYFYYSFGSYGYPDLEQELFLWILRNFSYWNEVQHEAFSAQVLSHMEVQFLEKLITHEDFIVKNEITLYNIIKKWLVDKMKLRDDYDYFRMWNRPEPFLETDEGKEFERLFSLLNLHQLLMETASIELLKKDNIYPSAYINRAGAENYMRLVQLAHNPPIQSIADFADESHRLAIFHGQNAAAFQGATVNHFGVHLKFGMMGQMLTVQRNRKEKETLFHHGPVTIRFRIAFYTPEKFEKDDEYSVSDPMEHEIRENELINLIEWQSSKDGNTNTYPTLPNFRNFAAMSTGSSPQALNLIAQNNIFFQQHGTNMNTAKFPKIVGIEMFFVDRSNAEMVADNEM